MKANVYRAERPDGSKWVCKDLKAADRFQAEIGALLKLCKLSAPVPRVEEQYPELNAAILSPFGTTLRESEFTVELLVKAARCCVHALRCASSINLCHYDPSPGEAHQQQISPSATIISISARVCAPCSRD